MKTAKFKKKIRNIKLTVIITLLGSIVMFVKFIDYFINNVQRSKTYIEGTNAICQAEICNTNHINALKEYSKELLNICDSFHLGLTIITFIVFLLLFFISLHFISLIRFFKKQEFDVKSNTDNEDSLN